MRKNCHSRGMNLLLYLFMKGVVVEQKWEHNETVHELFIDFEKAYNSVVREVKGKVKLSLCLIKCHAVTYPA